MRDVRVALVALAVMAVATLAACYQPRLPECAISCADDGFCPGELTCATNNLCASSATACGDVSIDAAVPDAEVDDAGLDAGGDTAVWSSMSVGGYHACAIDVDGALWCWGNNDLRTLGRTTPMRSGTPLQVDASGPTDWESVSAGSRHTCAIRSDGSLWCWGINDDRQCGSPSGGFVNAPTAVADPPAITGERWTAVTTGAFFTCALRNDGSLWCFGTSYAGQLGQGVIDGRSAVPLPVTTFSDWRSVEAGLYHVCGVHGAAAAAGQVACWGYDPGNGRIGDGANVSRYLPTPVNSGGVLDWRAVAVGDYGACALDPDGALYCWGDQYQQPGNVMSQVPTRYSTLVGVDTISVGGFGGCYTVAGQVSCWGDNDHAELAEPPRGGSAAPVPVGGLGTSADVDAGNAFVCALDDAGAIRCWGDTGDGQLGNGLISDHREPVEVLGGHAPWRQVDVGYDHTCATTIAGEMYCWGFNDDGQVGSAESDSLLSTPVEVGDTISWLRVSAGGQHSCAVTVAGDAYCWGANDFGQRGVGTSVSSPTPMMIASTTLDWVAAGEDSNCGVRNGTTARACWGDNDHTQLGNNSSSGTVATPTDISFGATTWSKLAMGVHFGCGITTSGILYCWGENDAGQTSRPTTDNPVVIPVQVPDPTVAIADSWIDVAVHYDHACGVLAETGSQGRLFCWGNNGAAQLGQASAGGAVPQQVGTDSDWVSVGLGVSHTCAVRNNGVMHCFGFNGMGQLGDGTPDNHAQGTPLPGFTDWVAVAASTNMTCGIRDATGRRLYCWGENRYGQLGVGESVSWVPVLVVRP